MTSPVSAAPIVVGAPVVVGTTVIGANVAGVTLASPAPAPLPVLVGSTSPPAPGPSQTFVVGTMYWNNSTDDVHRWDGVSWVFLSNIRGAGMVDRGDWSAATGYAAGDVVTRSGARWVARIASTNSEPTRTNPDWIHLGLYGQVAPDDPGGGMVWVEQP